MAEGQLPRMATLPDPGGPEQTRNRGKGEVVNEFINELGFIVANSFSETTKTLQYFTSCTTTLAIH